MTEENPGDGGFTIDMKQPGARHFVAMNVLKSRLNMGIHFRRTDAYALHSARGWAEKLAKERGQKPPVHFKTMKQALTWVESELEAIAKAREEAANG